MELSQLFDKELVFCLTAKSQEELFYQVADLLEERKIVKPSDKKRAIFSNWIGYGVFRQRLAKCSHSPYRH